MGPHNRNRGVRRNLFPDFEDAANQDPELAAANQQAVAENPPEGPGIMPGIQPLPAEDAADLAEGLAALVVDDEPPHRKRPHSDDDDEAIKRPRTSHPGEARAAAGFYPGRRRMPADDADRPAAKVKP